MSIKEFCLVPRKQVEAGQFLHQPISQVRTKLSVLQQGRQTPQNTPGEFLKPAADTSITDAVKIMLKPTEQQYAEGILSYLKKNPIIRWDDKGNMMSPIRDINIIDIIRYWVSRNSTLDSSKIPDLRMLVKLTGLPVLYIKNPKAKGQLFKGGKLPSKVRRHMKWKPY